METMTACRVDIPLKVVKNFHIFSKSVYRLRSLEFRTQSVGETGYFS